MRTRPKEETVKTRISATETGARAHGFTLLELLVVLSIIGLIVSVSLPNFRIPGFASIEARAARQIAMGLADARQQAIFRNSETIFILDLDARSFRAGSAPEVKLSGIERLDLIAAEKEVIDRARGIIRFYPDGSSSGGEIVISNSEENKSTVRVNWLTGRISMDDDQ